MDKPDNSPVRYNRRPPQTQHTQYYQQPYHNAPRQRTAQKSRQAWRSGAAVQRRKTQRRRRRRPMRYLLFLLCLALVGTGVWKLFTLGGTPQAAEPEPEEQAPVATVYAEPLYTLVIDAGHGGADSGALSQDKTIFESTVNREMLDLLTALFSARTDNAIAVLATTQPGETLLSREARAQVANDAGADLFISLHLNDNSDTSVNGFQVYAQPPSMSTNEQSIHFAELLAAQVGQNTQLKLIGGSGIYYMFYEDASTGYPYEYTSGILQNHANLDTYGVLQNTNCPAVLIEQWFITCTSDMNMMYNTNGMNTMANCIYSAICTYFSLEP